MGTVPRVAANRHIQGMIQSQHGSHWLEGFLYGRSYVHVHNVKEWTLFEEIKWPCPSKIHALPEERCLPELRAGDRVNCLGKVLTGEGAGLNFVCLAATPTCRYYAVVALPDGELTWAQAMSKEEGFLEHRALRTN